MMRWSLVPSLTLAFVAVAVNPLTAHAQNQELSFLHVLVVADTLDPRIGTSVAKDSERIPSVLLAGIPENRCKITVFKDRDANSEAILRYYRGLSVKPNEGLMFYFAGHGAIIDDGSEKDHTLCMSKGADRLPRSRLREAMKAKNPDLILLFTDCCSVDVRVSRRATRAVVERHSVRSPLHAVKPGYRELLFQARGVVDITAADDGDPSVGDPIHGGVFTWAFADALTNWKDDYKTWLAFYPYLKEKTEQTFVDFYGQSDKEPIQTSRALGLPGATWGFFTDEDGEGKDRTVKVREVYPKTPAFAAGLQRGDVILKVNGKTIRGNIALGEAIQASGDTFKLTVQTAGGDVVEREVRR